VIFRLLTASAAVLLASACGTSTPPAGLAAVPVERVGATTAPTTPAPTTVPAVEVDAAATDAAASDAAASGGAAVSAPEQTVVRATAPRPVAPRPVAQQPAAPKPAKSAPAGGCNPNYTPCVPNDPVDVDCQGGSGNGPSYVKGPVTVTGTDVYGLDADKNGIGCE
jgi:hypothetical protein